ncbi:MAG: hypothetical protein JO256_08160, partial [Alphaproteobacteria bacterium]|nr:hypothetical protein [Alphaproteobacteria bacterium]
MGTFPDPAIFLLSQRAGLAQLLCAQLYNVPVAELQAPSRGRPRAARARQIAIHLLRQVFRLS